MLLVLSLVKDHGSLVGYSLPVNQDDLLRRFLNFLSISPRSKKRDQAQLTCLVRALLGFSGGRIDRQPLFAEEYTVRDNADLLASLFRIIRTKDFENFDSELHNTLSSFQPFSRFNACARNLKQWIMSIGLSLRLCFPEGHLV